MRRPLIRSIGKTWWASPWRRRRRSSVRRRRSAALRAEIVELRAKLDRPPKTPDNSSIPPSRGMKNTTEFVKNRRKKKAHPGAHRPLSPNPTHRRDILAAACGHCGADVSQSPQEPCEVYDRIEIPPIAPEITRVSLNGGVCPCCARRFKAEAPAGLEPGSPFGPNLRAFVFYLRFTQGVGFERLSRLMRDLFGLSISEGALVNILQKRAQALRRGQRRHPRPAVVGRRDLLRRDRFAGGQAKLVAVGFPSRPERFFPGPSPTLQGRGRAVPRRRPPGRLGLRPLRRPGRLGRERAASLPRPSPARHAIRHRRGRRRLRPGSSPLHRPGVRRGEAARQAGTTPRSKSIDAASKPNLTGSWP